MIMISFNKTDLTNLTVEWSAKWALYFDAICNTQRHCCHVGRFGCLSAIYRPLCRFLVHIVMRMMLLVSPKIDRKISALVNAVYRQLRYPVIGCTALVSSVWLVRLKATRSIIEYERAWSFGIRLDLWARRSMFIDPNLKLSTLTQLRSTMKKLVLSSGHPPHPCVKCLASDPDGEFFSGAQ